MLSVEENTPLRTKSISTDIIRICLYQFARQWLGYIEMFYGVAGKRKHILFLLNARNMRLDDSMARAVLANASRENEAHVLTYSPGCVFL